MDSKFGDQERYCTVAELTEIIDSTPWIELTGDIDSEAFVERLERNLNE